MSVAQGARRQPQGEQSGRLDAHQLGRRQLLFGLAAFSTKGWAKDAGPIVSRDSSVDIRSFGARADGVYDDSLLVQRAIDALADTGGVIFIPRGVYSFRRSVLLRTGVSLLGEGRDSVFAVGEPLDFPLLLGNSVHRIAIESLCFSGSLTFPKRRDVFKYGGLFPRNAGLSLRGSSSAIAVRHCHFYELSNYSIDAETVNAKDLCISHNRFVRGSYANKVIDIRAAAGVSDGERISDVRITDNEISECGPVVHRDASVENFVASSDAIHLTLAKNSVVARNRIKFVAGNGIRVERCEGIEASDNSISNCGQDGINFYLFSTRCLALRNTITSWGQIPNAYCIRRYRGRLLVAREFPDARSAPLPSDPLSSGWFDDWRYSLTGVDMSSIAEYSPLDYYRGRSTGILPFRGYSAIATSNGSSMCHVVGNWCVGVERLLVDQNRPACDYGFTPVHSVNAPSAGGAAESVVAANVFQRCRRVPIYHPVYHDPINARGRLGRASYRWNTVSDIRAIFPELRLPESGSESPQYLDQRSGY